MGLTFEEIKIGDSASYTKSFTSEEVIDFSCLSGDKNPIHVNEEAGKASIFGARVVHGALVSSLFSTVFGTLLPGEGCIYLSQNSSFRKPVYLLDQITVTVKAIEKIEDKKFIKFETIAQNQNGEVVIKGEALLKPRSK
ncbi:MAG: MaoC family dehydratase [Acholeplasmatales bacterium]|jgi:3-hydroxybutyryl-CoA dehydratase|nr:MaoC family dehydratase [Acholeplasmatales bacterium]